MRKIHAKSSCCQATVIRFGNRRRQCTGCLKTFRIRRKKRGRKKGQYEYDLLHNTFVKKLTLTQQLKGRKLKSLPALSYHFRQVLDFYLKKHKKIGLPTGKTILIIDGLHFEFKGKPFVLYLMAIRSVNSSLAYLIDPPLLPGVEAASRWKQAINCLTPRTKLRIKALVADGFPGSASLAKDYGWVFQRCHFHLIKDLVRRRGKRLSPNVKIIREDIYQSIRGALITVDFECLLRLKSRISKLSQNPACSTKFRFLARNFLEEIDAFRAYLLYPQFNLPTTTNSLESLARILRQIIGKVNNPNSVSLWARGAVRYKRYIRCNGKTNQIN